jgi:hypothetical protein
MTDAEAQDEALAHLPVSQAKTTRKATARKVTGTDVAEQIVTDVDTLKREVQALAVMLNGLKENGESVRPSKVDNMSARLETLERQVQGKDGLMASIENLAGGIAADVDTQGIAELQQRADDVSRQVDKLKAAFEGSQQEPGTMDGLRAQVGALADRVANIEDATGDRIDSVVTEEIRRIVRHRAAFEQDLIGRLSNLESRLPGASAVVNTATGRVVAAPVGNVHGKVLALMDEVDHISKDRRASGGGVNYKFRGIEDAQNAVGAAMRKVRILLRPEVVSWEYGQEKVTSWDERNNREKTVTWSTSRLTMRYVFVSPDDGSEFVIEMVGEGKDNSDKSASKAASMACKYALFQALMIPFEQVDESDAQNDAIAQADRHMPPAEFSRQAAEPPASPFIPAPQSMEEKAAACVRFVQEATGQPAEQALSALRKAHVKAEQAGIMGYLVEGVPVAHHINTALQMVNAAVQRAAAARSSAQGVTRSEQLTGDAQRAAVALDPDMEADLDSGTAPLDVSTTAAEKEYREALKVLRGETLGPVNDDEITQAENIVRQYERSQP